MNLNLNPEQIAYLKGLDSKEKRREFLLDCLVENVIGKSEKIIFGNFDFLKDADLPRYLFPHEMEQIQRLNPSFTNTTAPRTFENRQEFSTDNFDFEKAFKESIEIRMPYNPNEVKKEIYKAEEFKWDKKPKLEDIIKSKLIIRGFKNEDLLNNRGLIGATIDETVIEVVKNYQSPNENTEAKFTKEDMKQCFNDSRTFKITSAKYHQVNSILQYIVFRNFDDYLKSIEK